MQDYFRAVVKLCEAGEPLVSVTMVDAVGSTPQDQGAKMLVTAQGRTAGTVGGGRIEHKAIGVARQLLANRPVQRFMFAEWNLQKDVGMTCGGVVRLFFEVLNVSAWRVAIFGAGHVAQCLVRSLLTLDCQVLCFDSRADWVSQLPSSPKLTALVSDDLPAQVDLLQPEDFVISMTMGHKTDFPVLQRIMSNQLQFAYLGVIGSQAKRKILVRELTEAGIAAELASDFRCPIGLPIGSNQPAEIAISIVAELLQQRDAAIRE